MEFQHQQIRCEDCNARLFDTNADVTEQDEAEVEIVIRCWRCKTMCVVYLLRPEAAVMPEEVLYYPK